MSYANFMEVSQDISRYRIRFKTRNSMFKFKVKIYEIPLFIFKSTDFDGKKASTISGNLFNSGHCEK